MRIYKKSLLSIEVGNEWSEDYYLMDAFGKTVAILHKTQSLPNGEWEYFASGAERECRLVDQDQNGTFGKNEVGFYLYDHLGNTRVTYTPTGFIAHPESPIVCVNEVNSVVDYFPYGKVLRHYNVTDERYLTTQHERDQETDLDYRGARYYDNEVGRFLSTDPWQDKYPEWSTYNYVMGNPIMLVDPTGKGPDDPVCKKMYSTAIYLMEEDTYSSFDDVYAKVNLDITVIEYEDGSRSISTNTQISNQKGVGVQVDIRLNDKGVIEGTITYSAGETTVSESDSKNSKVDISIPGKVGAGLSGGKSSSVSVGKKYNGSSASIGFTLVFSPDKNKFFVTNAISAEENETVGTFLEDADEETFPSDGPGNLEMYIKTTGLLH